MLQIQQKIYLLIDNVPKHRRVRYRALKLYLEGRGIKHGHAVNFGQPAPGTGADVYDVASAICGRLS